MRLGRITASARPSWNTNRAVAPSAASLRPCIRRSLRPLDSPHCRRYALGCAERNPGGSMKSDHSSDLESPRYTPNAPLPSIRQCLAGLVGTAVAVATLHAGATIYPTLATDVVLLRSDAIAFVTIEKIEASPSQPGLFSLALNNVDLLSNRLNLPQGQTLTLQTRGLLDTQRRLHIHRDIIPLEVGGRYLVNLRGGAWTSGPFAEHCPPIHAVRPDGVVSCAGGEIYGIGSHGLLCSTQAQQVGRPYTETQLASALRRALDDARIRRPDEARSVLAATQPLSFDGRAP